MAIEVEQKFRILDRSELERRLAALSMQPAAADVQIDCYFSHPGRDFAQTDEALRLRRVGEANYITYKGPKLDSTTKTRHEIEIPLATGQQSADAMGQLLRALGFAPVAEVRKRRVHSTLRWQGSEVDIALDEVTNLGNFVELEIVTSAPQMAQARECITSLARELGLADSERRSYLELLLATRDPR